MIKKVKNPLGKLDLDERNILTSFEKGEWKSVKKLVEERKITKKAAAKTLLKGSTQRRGAQRRRGTRNKGYVSLRLRLSALN